MKYQNVLKAFYGRAWAMETNAYHALRDLLHAKAIGGGPSLEEIDAWTAAKPYGAQGGAGSARGNQIAIIPLHGPMLNTVGEFERLSGMTSTRDFARLVRSAADDPQVREIVLDIDSPGGAATSVDVAAEAVRYARERKTVTAVTEGMMASAAYWVASQATRVVATPGAMVGSISVIYTHVDQSGMNEEMGVKVTHLVTGELKAAGNPDAPLDDTSRNELMRVAMGYHNAFVEAVATGRGRDPDFVQANWADGRVELGSTAKRLGMVDDNAALEEVLDEIIASARAGTPSASVSGTVETFGDQVEAFEATENQEGPVDMTPELLEALGLPTDATPEQATAAAQALQARTAELEAQATQVTRRALAHDALTTAALPSAGAELDAKFQAKVEQAAINAESDEAAQAAVTALIEERRELLTARQPALNNNPEIPAAEDKPKAENPLRGIRSSIGL